MTCPDATDAPRTGIPADLTLVFTTMLPAASPAVPLPVRESGSYHRYISSAAWQKSPARLAELKASGHRCRICNASYKEARLEVHHRTYRNFRCELPEDLTTLCHPCHLGVTGMERARKYSRFPITPPAHVPVISSPPLFDFRDPLEIV